MRIDGSVGINRPWRHAQTVRVEPASPASRDLTPRAEAETADHARRASDQVEAAAADRRGIAPAVRSRSTVIVYDGRSVDRRQTGDRRKQAVSAEPSSEFVTQSVAHENMLLDLRPDPIETRQARSAYQGGQDTSEEGRSKGIDLTI